MPINNRLRKIRKSKNMTQEELAKKVGVVQSTICSAEIGARELRDHIKAAVAAHFSVSVEWLFFEGRYPQDDQKQ